MKGSKYLLYMISRTQYETQRILWEKYVFPNAKAGGTWRPCFDLQIYNVNLNVLTLLELETI
jgi:hypothetical protein